MVHFIARFSRNVAEMNRKYYSTAVVSNNFLRALFYNKIAFKFRDPNSNKKINKKINKK